jgi:hypothetical protein
LCVKLVIYKVCNKMHGQLDIKFYNTGYLIDTDLMNVRSAKSSICLARRSSICHSASPTGLSLTNKPAEFPQYKTYRVPPRGQRHSHVGLMLPSNTVPCYSFYRNLTNSIPPSIFREIYRWRQNAFSKTLYRKKETATSSKVNQ